MKFIFLLLLIPSILASRSHAATLTLYQTKSYHGRSDNPILNNPNVSVTFIEDFESQAFLLSNYLTTPYGSGWNGAAAGSPGWGVQEDFIAGDGLGWVWTDSVNTQDGRKPPIGIHFDFTPDAQGRLPEYAGAALRGKGLLGNGPAFNVILVYDRNGVEVTEGQWQIPKPVFNPNLPIEDLFLNFEGIYVPGGISSIHFRDFTEVDHLTYGYSIPEPSSTLLATAAGLLSLRRKRKLIP
jgi:hypothetical protein